MTETEKCSQPKCPDAWTHLVYWPETTLQLCRQHANVAIMLAEAMAFHVPFHIPVTEVIPESQEKDGSIVV